MEGWPELRGVKVLEDDRIREQEHGKRIVYADKRLYFVFNPEYALLSKMSTDYEYRHEGGESLLDVRGRLRDFVGMLIREHGGLYEPVIPPGNPMLVTHHLAIMGMRANLERWDRERFLHENEKNRPPNCSVTTYSRMDTESHRSLQGRAGRMILAHENLILYNRT